MVERRGEKYVALTQQLAGIDRSQLGKEITNLSAHRSRLIAAIDFMLSGI
jgi:toxin CcdB